MGSAKDTDGKLKLTLVPRQIIREIAKIREYGNNKYPEGGPDNWKTVEVQHYRDAAFRHLLAYLDDPNGVDEESGLPHLSHLACNIAFLCEMENQDEDNLTPVENTNVQPFIFDEESGAKILRLSVTDVEEMLNEEDFEVDYSEMEE